MPTSHRGLLGLLIGCALALATGLPGLDRPGLYYDEVIQAEPALAFLRGEPPPRIPGLRALPTTSFPWMTQPYMGALKSQLLVPVFALLEPSAVTLRGATFALGLAGLVFWTLFAARTLGATVAGIAALLLASDPSFLFVARHDWGSFSLGLLLRGSALLSLSFAMRGGSAAAGFLGGASLGLGLYNKVDFSVFLVAAAVALAVFARRECRVLLAERPRWLILAVLGFALGVAPLAFSLSEIFRSTLAFGAASEGIAVELVDKLTLTRQVLNGSYFHRLMLAGGDFLALGSAMGALHSLGGVAFVSAFAALAIGQWRARGDSESENLRQVRLLLVCTAACFAALLLLPRGVRIHHTLNAWPLPQLVIACALAGLVRRGGVFRGVTLALILLLVAANLRVDGAIHRTLAETRGRGLWSEAITELARAEASGPLVALDWGFAGPIHFTRPELELEEPIWALRRPRARHQGMALTGTPEHRYLVFEPQYAVYPFGQALLRALEALPADRFEVVQHTSGDGLPVFREIRFVASHRLIHRAERFEVRFE